MTNRKFPSVLGVAHEWFSTLHKIWKFVKKIVQMPCSLVKTHIFCNLSNFVQFVQNLYKNCTKISAEFFVRKWGGKIERSRGKHVFFVDFFRRPKNVEKNGYFRLELAKNTTFFEIWQILYNLCKFAQIVKNFAHRKKCVFLGF